MEMNEAEVLDVLQKVGAFRTGHFVYTSGRHGDSYINKDALFAHAIDTAKLCESFAEHFKGQGIAVVLGPAVAAALLSQWTAYHLSTIEGREVFATYADKNGADGFIIKRGYDKILQGKKVLVVEDLLTTGSSVRKVVEVARAAGADVVGVGALCNRGNVTAGQIGSPGELYALFNIDMKSWEEANCELCKQGIPINTTIGHGNAFLAKEKTNR
jgi:orotate phosphoribosyltransferase